MNKYNDLVGTIDTSIMSKNIIDRANNVNRIFYDSVLSDFSADIFNILEEYSLAVQFAVKTHEKNLDTKEIERYSRLQREREDNTGDALINAHLNNHALNRKIIGLIVITTTSFGIFIGAMASWWLQ